uniref:NADH-ubiquinone oxidoreductase chain 5 n=1 Tax=Chaetopterus variopedatus TaxID=34590 RepID=A0A0S2N0D1_CHAVR|nr:NADH dehydrogenase subunit 5 [Chaetopterus variopedatus]ALO81668.1 NADH dehydrogenase subunit 5 [Chaetopterus variopedatus]
MFILEAQIFSPAPSQPAISLVIDYTSMIFIFTVSLISFSVLKFSSAYMASEPFLTRFNALVILFIVSMNLLILIPNMITLLLGWDGLGLISFLLVIYYQNPKSLAAGMLTFLTNRIGDALIILSIVLMMDQANWNILFMLNSPTSKLIALLVMLAAITKSAQIPFSSWLPAAMAAPTPVSALVHSSTLVTAGVYLLIRFSPFLTSSFWACNTLLVLSCLTSLMAGMSALFESDMKKIIALSTLSQLGIMMMSTALHMPQLTFFHLITHAMFKALLFICAGTLIHAYFNNQDLRMFGNISSAMPITSLTLSIANMALCGLPFLAGFYSKDAIIEASMMSTSNSFILLLTIFSTFLTAAYSMRMSAFTLWTPPMSTPMISCSDNSNYNYTTPMLIMTVGAIFSGAAMNWLVLAPLAQNYLPLSLKFLPLLVTILGGMVFLNNSMSNNLSSSLSYTSKKDMIVNMWYLTPISTKVMSEPFSIFSLMFLKINDYGWNELIGPQGLSMALTKFSKYFVMSSNPTLKMNISIILVLLIMMFLI